MIDYYELYPKDQYVPEYYGTRTKRHKPCEFGFGFIIDGFGQFARQQNDIIDWHLRRRYVHMRDQFSQSSKRFNKTFWGVPVSQSARYDAAHNFFSRGGKSITFTAFNFTHEVLDHAPAHITQKYLARYNGNRNNASKAVLHAGAGAGDPGVTNFIIDHAESVVNWLQPLKGTNTRIERENEIRWQPTSVWNTVSTPTRVSNFEFAKSIGWEPIHDDPLGFTNKIFNASGFEMAPEVDVHAYHTWLVVGEVDSIPRKEGDGEDRMTQFYHGLEWEGFKEHEVREAQGTNKMDAGEIKRVVIDCYMRGAAKIYNHTPALLFAPLYNYNNRWEFYSPYKSADAAKALLQKVGNQVEEHQGRCMLDPLADKAWNACTEVLTYSA
jgi:hypothetical protein